MINRKYLKLISIALILIISIGFAYLTSSLIINGIIGYKGNSWNIYFDNISMIKNDVGGAKPTINNSKDTVNFSITFSEPGETFKFSVDVVNEGTIDAMLSEILTTGINSSNSSYLSYTVKYYDDTELSLNDGIKAGTKTRLNVEVNYKYDTEVLAPVGNQDFSIKLTYVQAGDNATFKNTLINPDNNNVFTLNNAKSNSLNNLKIYGNNEQTTYEGYNLLNLPSSYSFTQFSRIFFDNTFTAGHYTFSYSSRVSDAGSSLIVIGNNTDPNNANSMEYIITRQISSSTKSFTFTLTEEQASKVNAIYLYASSDWLSGADVTTTFNDVMIYKGTDSKSYEPYVGGEPSPNPDYPQEINAVTNSNLVITGKNIYNPNYRNNGVIAATRGHATVENGVFTFNATGSDFYIWLAESSTSFSAARRGQVFPLGNRTYTATISNPLFTKNYVSFFDEDMNPLGFKSFNSNSFTFNQETAGSDKAKYFALRFGYANSVDGETYTATIQLEEGDTATEYEPYYEHSYPITLGNVELNRIGDYRDSIYYEDGDWYLEKKIGNYTITGSETYEWYSECPRICFNFGNIPPNNVLYPSNTTDMPYLMSNKFVTVTINDIHYVTYENRKNGFTLSNNNYISFRRKKWTDKATAVSESTGTIIYYVYRNSIKEKITDSTLLSQLEAIRSSNLFEGINHIYFNSNIGTDISFDYIEE
ncbi:MAG: hypothetical protein Q4E69_01795 [Bacilli bacterium]|nr:hypothetical protein [Bacilli bacterium]